MKIKYAHFRNPHFATGLKKLSTFERFSDKTKYRLMKMIEWVSDEEKKAQASWERLIWEFSEKTESGQIKSPEGSPPGSFRVPEENRAKFEEEGLKWSQGEVELTGVLPLERAQVNLVGLTAMEEIALVGFVEEISANEDEA